MRMSTETAENILKTAAHAAEVVEYREEIEVEETVISAEEDLTQFRTNLAVLRDLTARLAFLNREIRYVMKVD